MSTRPTLIPGERRILHGGDYNPDQWLHEPAVIDEDFRLMPLAGCQTFAVGIFAWSTLEPAEGRYDFAWLDRIMERMAAAGQRVILATPSGGKPAWLAQAHPEICRVDRNGRREHHHSRHNHCWSSPVYRAKVRAINQRLAERYRGHPALAMWHVSNEYGGECLCALCLDAWRAWLRQRYGTLDALNRAWWTTFWSHGISDWSQADPREWSLDGVTLDWLRFQTWQIGDFFQWEIEPLKRLTPDVPCTTNFMGLHPYIDYGTLSQLVDVVADDQYPGYDANDPALPRAAAEIAFKHDLYRCFKPDRPWMLMESCPDIPQYRYPTSVKRAPMHRLEMLQAIGHGAEGTCYFQWRKGRGGAEKFHGAVVDHDGSGDTRVFRSVAEVGALYQHIAPIVGTAVRAEVAQVYDWEARWAFEHTGGPDNRDGAYGRIALDHYRPFWAMGVAVDVVDSLRDLSPYRLVSAPLLWMLKPGVADRLRDYVRGGGTLVATTYTGISDARGLVLTGGWPGDGLKELFGLWHEETDVLAPTVERRVRMAADAPFAAGETMIARRVMGLVHARGGRALATYADDFYAGRPAVVENRYGKGHAIWLAAQFGDDFHRAFAGWLARDLGLTKALGDALPDGVSVQRRADGERSFLVVCNWTPRAQRVVLPACSRLSDAADLGGSVELPPFAAEVFAVR